MWIRTEQGAINLAYVTNIAVHESHIEGDSESLWIVCAEMADTQHITIRVYSDYDLARKAGDELCDKIVAASGQPIFNHYNVSEGISE